MLQLNIVGIDIALVACANVAVTDHQM